MAKLTAQRERNLHVSVQIAHQQSDSIALPTHILSSASFSAAAVQDVCNSLIVCVCVCVNLQHVCVLCGSALPCLIDDVLV